MTRPDCAWDLSDLDAVPKNGVTVMSTFACGGGSSMGYKRAGCTIIAANDIDPEMAWHYKRNLHPPLYYLCPIRDLLTADLPPELFNLDILDGSPPCSTFSMAGSREDAWGKEKHFREGQAKQVLSDLFFDWIALVKRLRPKVAIAENVKGMLLGNAKGYSRMVVRELERIGYRVQVFLVNAADCGVPQKRERVFFCCVRADVSSTVLTLSPQHRWVSAKESCADVQVLSRDERDDTVASDEGRAFWAKTLPGDSFALAKKRATGKANGFGRVRLRDDAPSATLTSNAGDFYHWSTCRRLTLREWLRLGSFPDDYVTKSPRVGKYMVGMSVPPKMAEVVARAVCEQWLGRTATREEAACPAS